MFFLYSVGYGYDSILSGYIGGEYSQPLIGWNVGLTWKHIYFGYAGGQQNNLPSPELDYPCPHSNYTSTTYTAPKTNFSSFKLGYEFKFKVGEYNHFLVPYLAFESINGKSKTINRSNVTGWTYEGGEGNINTKSPLGYGLIYKPGNAGLYYEVCYNTIGEFSVAIGLGGSVPDSLYDEEPPQQNHIYGANENQDDNISSEKQARIQQLVAKAKSIPMSKYQDNLELYYELMQLDPNNELYRTKYEFYNKYSKKSGGR